MIYEKELKLLCDREGKKIQISRSNWQEALRVIEDVSAEQMANGEKPLTIKLAERAANKAAKLAVKTPKAKKSAKEKK